MFMKNIIKRTNCAFFYFGLPAKFPVRPAAKIVWSTHYTTKISVYLMNKLDLYFYALMTRTVFVFKIYKMYTCIESVYKLLHVVIFTRPPKLQRFRYVRILFYSFLRCGFDRL